MLTQEENDKINILLKQIEDNNLFALAELMDMKTPSISTIAFNILKNESKSEEVVNSVLIALIKNIHNFKSYKNINGWINSVTINYSIDLLRKDNTELPFNDEIAFDDEELSNESQIIERLVIVSAIQSLDSLERGIFIDKYVNGLHFTELCKKYRKSIKAIRVILKKARDKFSEFYEKE